MTPLTKRFLGLIALCVVVALFGWAQSGGGPSGGVSSSDSTPRVTATAQASSSTAPGMPSLDDFTVSIGELPVEAQAVIGLIESGGPFEYSQDGSVFGNREKLLPLRERGYYREYTVPTPGSDDRGARRIVLGGDGELYYTADHYQSFRLVRATS